MAPSPALHADECPAKRVFDTTRVGEVCDDGNNYDCDGCSRDCMTSETGCGDGIICGAEVCDEGEMNGTASCHCSADCLTAAVTVCDLDAGVTNVVDAGVTDAVDAATADDAGADQWDASGGPDNEPSDAAVTSGDAGQSIDGGLPGTDEVVRPCHTRMGTRPTLEMNRGAWAICSRVSANRPDAKGRE